MAGPWEARLNQAVAGMNEADLAASEAAWKQGATDLAVVVAALRAAAPAIADAFQGQTGDAAAASFNHIADKADVRAQQMKDAATALGNAKTAMQSAQATHQQMQQSQPTKPSRPATTPGASSVDQVQAQKSYDSQMHSYGIAMANRETQSRAAVTQLDTTYQHSTATMKKVHGQPDAVRGPGSGTGGTTASRPVPTFQRPPGSARQPPSQLSPKHPYHNPGRPNTWPTTTPTTPTTTSPPTGPGSGPGSGPSNGPGGPGTPAGGYPTPGVPVGSPEGGSGPIAGVAPALPPGGILGGYGGGPTGPTGSVAAGAGVGVLGGIGALGTGGLSSGQLGLSSTLTAEEASLSTPIGGARGGGATGGVLGRAASLTALEEEEAMLARNGAGGGMGGSAGAAGRGSRSGTGSRAGARGSRGSRAGVGAGAGRGRDRKDRDDTVEIDIFDTEQDWLDDEGAAPAVID